MPAGNLLARISQITVTLSLKVIKDSGMGTANALDVGGTTVNFNKSFIDIQKINVTPKATSAIIAVYDFVDDPILNPNPTSFSVYLFNTSGARVSGDFSWSVEGV